MIFQEVVGATGEPVTLEEVRVHLRIENVAVDPDPPAMPAEDIAWCSSAITAARQWAETFLGFPLSNAIYQSTFTAFPAVLDSPVGSIESIQYLDAANALQTLDPAEYDFDRYLGTLSAVTAWPVLSTKTSPVRLRFRGDFTVARVTPTVAEVPVPASVKHALLLLVGHWYANREAVVVGSAASEIPLGVESLLRPLRIRMGMA